MNLGIAIALAAEGFKNTKDKSGEPYILHCLRVMNDVHTEDQKIIAILHDCIEDGVCTFADLYTLCFKENIIASLRLLTHDKRTTYDDYIKKLAFDNDASVVKMADLKDNSNITRLKGLSKKDFDRMEKYHRSYIYLKNR